MTPSSSATKSMASSEVINAGDNEPLGRRQFLRTRVSDVGGNWTFQGSEVSGAVFEA
jgi:hypothetical protein